MSRLTDLPSVCHLFACVVTILPFYTLALVHCTLTLAKYDPPVLVRETLHYDSSLDSPSLCIDKYDTTGCGQCTGVNCSSTVSSS